MKKNVSKQFLDIYGIGLKTSLNFHKKIGLNGRKSPLKLKKNQQNYFKNQLNLIPNNKDLKIHINKISKFLIKIKKSKKIKFYKDDNKKTKIKTDRKK
jgi:ribosomal protein S13